MNFRGHYEELLLAIKNRGAEELNERTGAVVHVGHPRSFTLELFDGLLPVCGVRKVFPRTAAAEVAWFLQGDPKADFIAGYAPIWDKFLEEDGTVNGAYGPRWRSHFGRDQLGDAIEALVASPSDRRIYISTWDPAVDGLGRPSKCVPCPVGFTLSVTAGRLSSTLLIRSSDVFVGLPYDVMGHALLMSAIQASLAMRGVAEDGLGYLQVCLAHPHLYDVHLPMVKEAFAGAPSDDSFQMPGYTVNWIASYPDSYVGAVQSLAAGVAQPSYSCRPELIV